MNFTILFFGISRDITKVNSLEVNKPEGFTVKNLRESLMQEYPELKKINSLAVAVNEDYATDNYEIENQDVVAIIPPVSGG